jgi:MoaA/NifB/PqqE/SkfB family radical SAM enzyme
MPAARPTRASDDFVEARLVVTARSREPTRLDDLDVAAPPDPPIEDLARILPPGSAPWLSGGEPTLRADLPELVAALTQAGHAPALLTDGLALVTEAALGPLVDAGLAGLRVFLHSARPDAHDWLVRRSGAARRVVRAIRTARALGLAVEIEAVITRPTQSHLAELVEAAAALGVARVCLRRLSSRGPAQHDFVALSPRFALLEPQLERARAQAERSGVSIRLHDIPECAAGRAREQRVGPGRVHWHVVEGEAWAAARAALAEPPRGPGCPSCPGLPACGGAPLDYVARFGNDELRSMGGHSTREPQTVPEVLRFRFGAPSRVSCPECGDAGLDTEVEPTRRVRMRLVRAAREGAKVLRVASAGSLAHPSAAALLRETTLLAFERVEVAGEGSALDEMSDAEVYLLRGVHRLDVALFGPDAASHDAHMGRPGAFDATLRGLERFARLTGATVGAFAVLHDEERVADFARAWAEGRLPGEPAFRLSARGAALAALSRAGGALSVLGAVLPPCLAPEGGAAGNPGQLFDEAWVVGAPPSGCDRYGTFGPCACTGPTARPCPGVALGWELGTSS